MKCKTFECPYLTEEDKKFLDIAEGIFHLNIINICNPFTAPAKSETSTFHILPRLYLVLYLFCCANFQSIYAFPMCSLLPDLKILQFLLSFS